MNRFPPRPAHRHGARAPRRWTPRRPSAATDRTAIGGASGGTFDLAVIDHHVADEKLFRAQFPALKGAEIRKKLLVMER